MKTSCLNNRRWIAFFLSLAVMFMTLPSGASWQCPDGHVCAPDCLMQHGDAPKRGGTPHACCKIQKNAGGGASSCDLCKNSKSKHAQLKSGCTSNACILRMQAKSDVIATSIFHFNSDSDAPATLPSFANLNVAIEATRPLTFSSPRAPPDRLIVSLSSPRAPPIRL